MAVWSDFAGHLLHVSSTFKEKVCGKYSSYVTYSPEQMNNVEQSFTKSKLYMDDFITSNPPRLDRHKLLSALAKGFLHNPIFAIDYEKLDEIDDDERLPFVLRFPNEYFVFVLMRSLLTDFGKIEKKELWGTDAYDFDYPHQMHIIEHINDSVDEYKVTPVNFSFEMVKLLNYLHHQKPEEFPLMIFAQMLLMMEIASDCGRHDYKKYYYS
jgi:hypothetical protein